MRSALGCFVAVALWTCGATAADAESLQGPLSTPESLARFVLDPALRIELVASEPQIVDPVAMHFAADGSLWVVELRDYPYGPKPGEKPQSQIKKLVDNDGDGRYETATVFADELLFVTGVLPYRDGLIVTLAGQIAFFADRDGDGRAEVREPWFSGFAQENSQLRANHPTFGPDGYVYVANGLRGGKIVAERPQWKKSDEPLVITGFDFRFHPETGDFGAVTGHGQFGLTFDDFGRRFVCSNRNPCAHVVLEDSYLKRNPNFGAKAVMNDVAAAAEKSRLYPISKAWTTSTLHANQFTAACGVTIYRGDALPLEFYGNAFTCDPTGNLVHREALTPDGVTFAGKPPYDGREFLASPDTWFRPVNLAHGPDGALYVVDMYRAVIEHPDFMPTELKTRPDLRKGDDRGRIWRIVANDAPPYGNRFQPLVDRSPAALIAALERSNSWRRETAARLLLEQPARDSAAEVERIAQRGAQPAAQFLGLHILEQWDRLTPEIVKKAFAAEAPEVREAAFRLAEVWFEKWAGLADPVQSERFEFAVALQQAATAARTPRESFQAALSSMWLESGPMRTAIVSALAHRADLDGWSRQVVVLAANDQPLNVLESVLLDRRWETNRAFSPETVALVENLVSSLPAATNDAAVASIVPAADAIPERREVTPAGDAIRWAIVRGLGHAAGRRGRSLTARLESVPEVRTRIHNWLERAAATTYDASTATVETKTAAVRTLRFAEPPVALPALLAASEGSDMDLSVLALDTLAAFPQPEFGPRLLQRLSRSSPALRRAILDNLLASDERVTLLLAALERGDLKPAEIDPVRQARLTKHRLPEVRARAEALIAAASADRVAVLKTYESALTLPGDALRGQAIFEKQCMTCHRVADRGVNVGPDIGDTRDKTPATLMLAILDPNRAVDNNYFAYTAVTSEGKVFTGLLTADTSSSITLRQPEGKMETLLRSDIEELKASGQSLMPVGFEKNVTVEQMADLLSFLKNWRYLDGSVPLSGK